MEGDHDCDEMADCTNLNGSYSCACRQGYEGDGFSCREDSGSRTTTSPGDDDSRSKEPWSSTTLSSTVRISSATSPSEDDNTSKEPQESDSGNHVAPHGILFVLGFAVKYFAT